ncbi:bile acid:sodium symporter family protein [Paenibacillus sp. HB172176]|uniref:bile acid:sodium symporter family protein n=1 Tax=Paenibacillus sp. HB172176 TaxID=2493690 RepID=UPI001F10F512|nr:bile acid:sodium symporter family protein [Paenibacillus sp. HB172176]
MKLNEIGLTFNKFVERWMFLIVPGCLLLGFVFSESLQPYVEAVPYMFGFVTLTMALDCGIRQLGQAFRRPSIMILTFTIAHIVSPLIAYGIGTLAFGYHSPYVIGLVLFTIIPLGVSTVLWVGMSGGSVALILAMVVLDSLLSPIIVPAGVHLFFQTSTAIDAGPLMLDLTILIVLPTIIGIGLHDWSRGRIQGYVKPYTAPISKLCFVSVVGLNASAIAPYMNQLKGDIVPLVAIVVVMVGLCYALGFFSSSLFRDQQVQTTVSYATGMRNISLGIVLALGYFSPLAAVPVVLSILIQQPFATIHHYVLQKLNKKSAGVKKASHVR